MPVCQIDRKEPRNQHTAPRGLLPLRLGHACAWSCLSGLCRGAATAQNATIPLRGYAIPQPFHYAATALHTNPQTWLSGAFMRVARVVVSAESGGFVFRSLRHFVTWLLHDYATPLHGRVLQPTPHHGTNQRAQGQQATPAAPDACGVLVARLFATPCRLPTALRLPRLGAVQRAGMFGVSALNLTSLYCLRIA